MIPVPGIRHGARGEADAARDMAAVRAWPLLPVRCPPTQLVEPDEALSHFPGLR
jgi:hypothetical protein